jgi:amino acid adenylation domain-containing protein
MTDLAQQLAALSPEQRALLERRLQQRGLKPPIADSIPARATPGTAPLSFAQQRLWFIQQLDPSSSVYNVPCALRLRGDLQIDALSQTLNQLVARHETLRTTFAIAADGQPVQQIAPAQPLPLPQIDLRRAPAALATVIRDLTEQPFSDLSQPLLRVGLVRLGDRDWVLILTTHHSLCDRWSVGVFLRELSVLYGAAVQGQPTPLTPLPIQYGDWALWQRQQLQGAVLDAQIDYWQTQLAQLAPLELPTDRPHPAQPTYQGASLPLRLPVALSTAIKQLCAQSGVTLFTGLVATFQVLLHRYTQQDDVVVGTDIANRDRSETAGLIGLLVNTLVLRTDASGNPSFREFLERVRQTVVGAITHRDLPFEKLVEVLNPDRHLSQMSPLFQAKFDLQLAPVQPPELPGLAIERLSLTSEPIKYELRFNLQDTDAGISGQIEYSTDLFEPATIARMAEHYQTLWESIIAQPDRRLSQLSLLTPAEQQQLITWNRTQQDFPPACLHELFTAQATRTPSAIALLHPQARLTYRELDHRANQLAHQLQSSGIQPGDRVGVFLPRSPQLVIALLAILKVGAAYVPLDPAYPAARSGFILQDAAVQALVVNSAELPWSGEAATLKLLDLATLQGALPAITPPDLSPDHTAYIIYTSGSTGQPKGVAIAHRSAVALMHWARQVYDAAALAGVLAATSICFDLSVFEIFVPLCWGGSVILCENALALPELPDRNLVTLINTVPSAIAQLSRLSAIPASVQVINLAGEALSPSLVQQLQQHPQIQQIYNLYGPSEDTTYSTCACVFDRTAPSLRLAPAPTPRITIGRPLPNTQAYILDRHLQPLPVGIPGELYLAGAGIAQGYLKRPQLTAEKFLPNPLSPFSPTLYKTGDRARYLPDGTIEFLGRLDNQIKLRGFRIELGEIEANLSQLPSIEDCAVMLRTEPGGDPAIVAYVVCKSGDAAIPAARQALAQRLPSYMLPSLWISLPSLPRLPNGKLNRAALPTVGRSGSGTAPQTEAEAAIADIWQTLLPVTAIGRNDNFFELGGHSLLGIQIIGQINTTFQVNLPLRTLFEQPTIAGIASRIDQLKQTPIAALPPIQPDPAQRHQPFPLTDIQQAYWIGRNEAFELGNVATHGYREIETTGLTIAQVEQALNQLIQRHDMLRVTVLPDGQQVIVPTVPRYQIAVLDLRQQPRDRVSAELATLRDRLSHQVLPTDRYPLFDIQAAQLTADRLRFFVSFDVLLGDAWSLQILGQELVQLLTQPETLLSPLTLSFRDYVLATLDLRQSDAYATALSYWRDRLPKLPPAPELPLRQAVSAITQPRFERRSGQLPPPVWQRLKQRATQSGITPSVLLLTAFAEILTQWSRSPRFTLNLTLFNRLPLHPEVNQLVGDFTASTLLAIDQTEMTSFQHKARQIQAQLWEDLDHRAVSGVEVLRELARSQPQRSGVLMPVVFTSILTQTSSDHPATPWQADVMYSLSQTSQVYLDHQVAELAGALVFNWDAIDDLFPPGLLDQMFAAYANRLAELAEISDWQHLPVAAPLLQAQAEVHFPRLETLFYDQVKQRPDHPAVITPDRHLSYQELRDRAQLLAAQLTEIGIQSGDRVAIVMEKGWEQVVAVLGILTAGAAYVPIDADLPPERQQQLVQQAEVASVITQPWIELPWNSSLPQIKLPANSLIKSLTNSARGTISQSPPSLGDLGGYQASATHHPGSPSELAYIIYTSGSTGTPKGVMIDHQGAVNTILDINDRFAVTGRDRVFAVSSLSFDLSVYDIFGTLAAGATLVMPAADRSKDPLHWLQLAQEQQITVWNSVPALMQLLLDALNQQLLPMLRLVLLSGDWIPLALPDRLRQMSPTAEVISLGGATEASIWSIYYPISAIDPNWTSIPYGFPLKNQQVLVLDQQGQRRPTWVPGDLYIGGLGLAQGYWRDDAKTSASFIQHPQTGERLYKTGDLGRYLPDGSIEFLGREDFQVKINGYRIELGEIEAVLQQHPLIQAAIVQPVGDPPQLAAYLVPADSNPLAKVDFKLQQRGLRRSQPSTTTVALPKPPSAIDLRRQSYRQFLSDPIALAEFSAWLGCLAQQAIDGSPLPKYRYPSAGSLYPVQTYVYVKPDRVIGIASGIYYYHPGEHELVLISTDPAWEASLYPGNQAIAAQAAFALFFIAEFDAISPVYGDRSRDFCLLEAGYMSQLLMQTAPEYELGLCPIGNLDFAAIQSQFDLQPSQELVHSVVGGRIAPRWMQQWVAVPVAAPETGALSDRLRQYLQQKLPSYMIPTSYQILGALPLTTNGKVDRRSLPMPPLESPTAARTTPSNELERRLAQLWQAELGIDHLSMTTNFFELGGNSLAAIRLITQIQQTLQVEFSIREFLTAPTIAAQAVALQAKIGQSPPPVATIPKLERSPELLQTLDRLSEAETDALLQQLLAEEGTI